MIRKITSILLLVQFASAFVAPLVHVDNCDMVCCTSESDSKAIQDLKRDCEVTMTECHPAIFLPVVNAPKPVFSQEDLSKVAQGIDEFDPFLQEKIFESYYCETSSHENIPPDINLPLLI